MNDMSAGRSTIADAAGNPRTVVVGIGASAGGVPALQTFFQALPAKPGAAFVVVTHLSPDNPSELAHILSSRTAMTVRQVTGTVTMEPDCVYVIPPGFALKVRDLEISTVPFHEPRGRRAPIDTFFRSLSEGHGDGFAIIMTGAGSDGSTGIKEIKDGGGIILVQDPREAEYPSMPRSAVATGLADFILPLKELSAKLIELIKIKKISSQQPIEETDEQTAGKILTHVRVRTGHDFSEYKRSTILRRILRRSQVTSAGDIGQYENYLKNNPPELQALFADLLISVTAFFRDPAVFDRLAETVIPHLFKDRDPTLPLRIWVPGCATGEEAYTLAMLFLEEAAHHRFQPPLQIFASDLDVTALATAREGRYPAGIELEVSEQRLARFFTREGDHYRVKRELRDVVLFATHSLIKDPPFSRLDFISCRNLLIYLDRDLQAQAATTFHYALNNDGYLLLGQSENADNPPGLFRVADREARIFQSASGVQERISPSRLPGLRGADPDHPAVAYPLRGPAYVYQARSALHVRALEDAAPPSILVDGLHRIVHLSESAGRYMHPAGGPLTASAVDMVRPELRFDLQAALYRTFERNETTLTLPVLVKFNGSPRRVYMLVKPVGSDTPKQAVVMFIEGETVLVPENSQPANSEDTGALQTISELKEELQLTQSRLRATREESEAANEELRAANEELQSINEEYRSTAEELKTSKEELQSLNEELTTVNNELKLRLQNVSHAHNDLQNLMAATDIGTLFLDLDLRIKLFTSRVTDLFNIMKSDEGRSITDFRHQFDFDGIATDARTVIDTLMPQEREIYSQAGRWYLMRLRPYRTLDHKIDGVVVTFVDVSSRKRMEEDLRQSEEMLRHQTKLVDKSMEPIFVWELAEGIAKWNAGCEHLYGYSSAEALGRPVDGLLKTVPGLDERRKAFEDAGASWRGELTQTARDGRVIVVDSRQELVRLGGKNLVFQTDRDITGRKAWEAQQRMLLMELTHRVKNTLAVVRAVARQTLRTGVSPKEFAKNFDGRILALANAHEMLVKWNWQGAELAAMVRDQVAPYLGENETRLKLDGPDIMIPADLATRFAMILHELATNAAKYGALSSDAGIVRASWTLAGKDGGSFLTFIWDEKDGPPVTRPLSKGFGTVLIESSLPGAAVEQVFKPDGVVCTFTIPFAALDRPENGLALDVRP